MRSVFLVFFGATLVACVPSPEDTAPATPTAPAEATADLAVESDGFCANVAGGPATEDDGAVALSLAHANVRYFGLEPTHAVVDAALVEGIASAGDRVGPAAAQGFARALPSVCFVAAASTPLGEAKVSVRDGVAFVRPGTGSVEIPADARAAVLDLRDVPDAAGLEDALARATSLLLDTPLRPLTRRVHVRTGFTDEAFAEQALYTEEIGSAPLEAPTPRARGPLPLAVAIGSRVAPAGARIAAHLRATRRAWLLGEPLAVEVAETRWAPITATRGVAWRAFDLSDGDGRLPDVIAPDGAVDDRSFTTAGTPPPIAREASRAKAVLRRDFGAVQKTPLSVASARAALVSAHGATKLFFPYFGVHGDVTDARLRETLDAAKDVASRDDVRKLLRRFGNAISDGHNWVIDGQTPARGVLPIMLDRVDGGIVVTRSYDPAFRPGDLVVSFDGVPAERWFARETERTYGATEGFRFFTAMQELTSASIPKSIVVRAPDGTTRTVTPSPRPFAGLPRDADLFAGSLRKRGFLADLGAPDVYYMNLDGTYVADDADVLAGLAEAAAARALVLDMRGHPANGGARWNPYDLLQRLVPTSFSSPKYRVPVLSGDGARADIHPYEDTYPPLDGPSFRGRIVYIVDHQAVSFAEDFSLMLVGARRATVVGRPTAGTTGSVSGMQLPGGFQFYFTGMEARWPDGSTHFGQGIVPDVLVTPKVDDYAAGRDPFLAAAITVAKK